MPLLTNPEVLRRLAMFVGFCIAVVMFFVQTPYLIEVELPSGAGPLRVPGVVREPRSVSGPQWQQAARDLTDHAQGRTPEKWLPNRSSEDNRDGGRLFFLPGQEPFDSVAGQRGPLLLSVEAGGKQNLIRVQRIGADWVYDAPMDLAYPWRRWSWITLALGLAAYLFLPKVAKPQDSLGYGRLWGLVVSDILGLAIAGLCLWLLISEVMDHEGARASIFDFERGLGWLAVGTGLGAALGLFVMLIGAWYRNFWVSLGGEAIERHTLFGTTRWAFADMEKAFVDIMPVSKGVMFASMVGGAAGSVRSAGNAAQLSEHMGLGIALKDGRTKWIRLEGFAAPQQLVTALKDRGVELDETLEQMLE